MVESRSAIFSRDTASKNRAANVGAAKGSTAQAAALAVKFRRERFDFEGPVIELSEAFFAFMSMCPKIAAVVGKDPNVSGYRLCSLDLLIGGHRWNELDGSMPRVAAHGLRAHSSHPLMCRDATQQSEPNSISIFRGCGIESGTPAKGRQLPLAKQPAFPVLQLPDHASVHVRLRALAL